MTNARLTVLKRLAAFIDAVQLEHPMRVGIDGIDASGKTSLGGELVEHLERLGRPVIPASIDRFQRPSREQNRRGRLAPIGYYQASFQFRTFADELLAPLGPGGSLLYRDRVYDARADVPVHVPQSKAPRNAILVCDGVFLFRPELFTYWDVRVFIEVDFETSMQRAIERDWELGLNSEAEVRALYASRFHPGYRMYLDSAQPESSAHVIVHNDDLDAPTIEIRQPG